MTRRSASRGLLYSAPPTTESNTETATKDEPTAATETSEAAAADD